MREERQNRPRSFISEKVEPVNADKGSSETSQLQTGKMIIPKAADLQSLIPQFLD
jgi:hypothetical protein